MVPKIPFLTACSLEKKTTTKKKKKKKKKKQTNRFVGGLGHIFPLHQQSQYPLEWRHKEKQKIIPQNS